MRIEPHDNLFTARRIANRIQENFGFLVFADALDGKLLERGTVEYLSAPFCLRRGEELNGNTFNFQVADHLAMESAVLHHALARCQHPAGHADDRLATTQRHPYIDLGSPLASSGSK